MSNPLPADGNPFGEELRDLRRVRRLSLAGAATRAGMTPGALGNWENGRRTPQGAPLDRLLSALEAPPRHRARLLALADPAYARIRLASEPMGAPVHVGVVLRALRGRAGMNQAELARRVGVGQSTVARWEAGDDVPDRAMLHAAMFAVGATVEEANATTRTADGAPPDGFEARFDANSNAPHDLREALTLSLERDLWWRATVDPSVEGMLARALAARAHWCEMEGRGEEVAPLVRRAQRLAVDARSRNWVTTGLLTLAQIRLWRGDDPYAVADEVGAWTEGLSNSGAKAWSLATQALALAAAGDSRAVGIARSSIPLGAEHDPEEAIFRLVDLAQVHLALGEPDLALEALDGDYARGAYARVAGGLPPWGLSTRARALAAADETPEPELLPALRGYVERTGIPRYTRELRQAERALARPRKG